LEPAWGERLLVRVSLVEDALPAVVVERDARVAPEQALSAPEVAAWVSPVADARPVVMAERDARVAPERAASVPVEQQASLQVARAVPEQERPDVPLRVGDDWGAHSVARLAVRSAAPVARPQPGEQESQERWVCLPGWASSPQKRPGVHD
jgi:hypothetical protein